MLILSITFILCSLTIVVSGTFLSKYGDVIAEKAHLGRAWIGLILMAGVTSLPELINGISSVVIVNAPDIAIGDIMGSCVFNLSIIALLDILHKNGPIFSRAEHGHILSAGFGVVLIGLSSISLLSNEYIPSIGFVGLYTPIIILIYAIAIRSVFLFQKKKISEHIGELNEALQYKQISSRTAIIRYSMNAVVIIIAASFLPFIADRIAVESGLGKSFVGTIFVGMATSLPELVVSIAALKIGAADLAIANLFGSNMFNIFILAIDDIFYTGGPILSNVSMNHVVTSLMAILMTGIAIVCLTYRLERKAFLRLGWDAIAILLSYIVNIYLLYLMRGSG